MFGFAPSSILILVTFLMGMLLSLLAVGWLILSEKSGYKGPSKVLSEQYKRSVMRHPEVREIQPGEPLLVADLTKFLGDNRN